jgi:NOL1/NOP2/sun family putative RNA methylase
MDLQERYKKLCPDFQPVATIRPSLRINTLKISDHDLIQRLQAKKVTLEKIPYLSHGYWYEAPFSLGATPEYLQGYYYLQEAASQMPAEILDPKQGETVLDMACAPGGKLTQMAALMQNNGILVGIDPDIKRMPATENNCERLEMTNSMLYNMDGREIEKLGMTFDKILLDAPCSGNYATEKNYFRKRSMKDFENRAKLQKELLTSAWRVLKKDGKLLYATCSLEPEEDELVIDWAIKTLGAVIEKMTISIGDPGITEFFGHTLDPSISNTRRFWPHRSGTQGFFVAKLAKK